jgi:hypothetical protein
MQFDQLKRREFISLLGGVTVAWPVGARSQSAENVRRVGILWPGASPPASPRLESFREGLREAGFIEGENLLIELRYSRTGRATDMKLEGIVSKMAGAPYRSGRCEHWLKVKCWRRDRFVVVGFVPEGASGIMKLRLARRESGALIYIGRVGP